MNSRLRLYNVKGKSSQYHWVTKRTSWDGSGFIVSFGDFHPRMNSFWAKTYLCSLCICQYLNLYSRYCWFLTVWFQWISSTMYMFLKFHGFFEFKLKTCVWVQGKSWRLVNKIVDTDILLPLNSKMMCSPMTILQFTPHDLISFMIRSRWFFDMTIKFLPHEPTHGMWRSC